MALFDPRSSDRRLLDHDHDMALVEATVQPIWYYPLPRDGSDRLPWRWWFVKPQQREAFALVWLERETANGGFAQFFLNSSGYFVGDILSGCRRFALPRVERIVRAAASVFPGGTAPRVRRHRNQILEAIAATERAKGNGLTCSHVSIVLNNFIFDSLNTEFDDETPEMYRLLAAYIRAHATQFFR